jgi:hypothetical protein
MKTTTLKAAAAFGLGALLMGSAAAQESVSKPVGYETITIDQQFNYMGLRLLGAPLATSTVATAENDAITLTSGTVADGPVIVEVIDGDATGAVVEGTATAGSISVPAGLLDNLEVDNTVTVRAPQTLDSVFGTPVRDLDGSGGPGAADLILIPDGLGGFTTYYYNTVFTLTTQFNYLSTVYPAGATLSSMFDAADTPGILAAGSIDGSGGPGAADLVLIPEGNGFKTYYYNTGGFGGAGAGWKEVDSSGASIDVTSTEVSLDSASSVIIQNRGATPQGVNFSQPAFYADL